MFDVNQNGFTAAGPIYVDTPGYIETCVKNEIPIVITIDLRNIVVFSTAKDFININEKQVETEVSYQVERALALNPIVFGWYVLPDELRTWRANEMYFLKTVSNTIRKYSNQPIISYSPNNRDSLALKIIADNGIDYIGKQAYVKFNINQNRTIIKYAIKTATRAYNLLENKTRFAVGTFLMLAEDPFSASDDKYISMLARHDIFIACAHGAEFLIVWSLFRRPIVHRTYDIQYYGYVNAIKEINKEVLRFKNQTFSLAEIFLNSKKNRKIENLYHTHIEYEITSNLKLTLDINSANHAIKIENATLARFEVKYEIIEDTQRFNKI